MIAPLIGVILARRFGATRLLAVFLIIPALAVLLFFLQPGLWAVIALLLFLVFFDAVWDPVAEAYMHGMIPSSQRATIGSIVSLAGSVAMVAGIGLFALLIRGSGEALQAATPDLITAFSGGVSTQADVPTGLFGLPIPDLAILLFVFAGLGAVPFLMVGRTKPNGGTL
jgi:sugar phosphate permease